MAVDLRKSSVIYRELKGNIEEIVSGHDQFLITNEGKSFFDFSAGPCVSALGHSNGRLKRAIIQQVNSMAYSYSGFWATDSIEQLGHEIKSQFERTWPGWFGKVAFASSGNEAVEFACRLAFQYWLERRQIRDMYAVRKYSFHGTSLLSSALTDDYGKYSKMSAYCTETRNSHVLRLPGYVGCDHDDVDEYEEKLLDETWGVFNQAVAAGARINSLILEPVGGPPVGASTPTSVYLKGLRELCDHYGILLIFDEILCGCGRIGDFTAAQLFNVKPDIILLGKALTSGYIPLSAVVLSKEMTGIIERGSGVAMVGTTYFNHPVACACALASLEYMKKQNLFEQVKVGGDLLFTLFSSHLAEVPIVKRLHGKGYLWGIQLQNPDTGDPFDPKLEMHKRVRKALYDEGLITYTKGQTVDGYEDYIILSPPYETEIALLCEMFMKLKGILMKFDWRNC